MKQQSCSSSLLWLMILMWVCIMFTFVNSQGRDTLEPGQGLRDWEFLESSGKKYQFRFFSPDFTTNRYLGIQFVPYLAKFVWVANRDRPFKDTSAVLNFTRDGILVINYNNTSITLNSDQQAIGSSRNLTLRLLDSGNLVLRSGEEVIWQSFDYPTDTYLPGMKLGLFGLKEKKPRQQSLTSWLTPSLPASGAFTFGVDPNNTKKLVIWRRGVVYWQSGNWNSTGLNFQYDTGMNSSYFPENFDENPYRFIYTSNENESYFTLSVAEKNLSARISINSSGSFDMFTQTFDGAEWYQSDVCDARSPRYSSGCARLNQTHCSKGDEFFLTGGAMSAWNSYSDQSVGISDCKEICRKDCSCNAYTSADSDGTGCMFSDQTKMEENDVSNPELFYIRNTTVLVRVADPPVADSPLDNITDQKPPRKRSFWEVLAITIALLLVGSITSLALLAMCILCYLQRSYLPNGVWTENRAKKSLKNETSAIINELGGTNLSRYSGSKDQDLPSFSFSTLQCATENFSIEHKLGQGGFGSVYKGVLENGQEIAVKRLSQTSGQGINEFKNEVLIISKLQHRNLVRLLGCCIQGEEKLLVYEYMPNKSLDSSLFDVKNQLCLDWGKRFCIIEGIAQGLLYLHKYSRLRIIHRDLKTSNILLDADLTPKISDFGLARTFRDNESRGNTRNIAGTRGYMSPEYAMGGLFSIKSDVFSFGVMVLEIISGKKNASFHHCDRFFNLLGYAWELWKQDMSVDLMDPTLAETSTTEVSRCLHIGLLCVQENAADRPTMSDVVSMLNNETIELPVPKKPAFFTVVGVNEVSPEAAVICSINGVTVSDIEAR